MYVRLCVRMFRLWKYLADFD